MQRHLALNALDEVEQGGGRRGGGGGGGGGGEGGGEQLVHAVAGAGDVADPALRGRGSVDVAAAAPRAQLPEVLLVDAVLPHEEVVSLAGEVGERGHRHPDQRHREKGVHGAAVGDEDDEVAQEGGEEGDAEGGADGDGGVDEGDRLEDGGAKDNLCRLGHEGPRAVAAVLVVAPAVEDGDDGDEGGGQGGAHGQPDVKLPQTKVTLDGMVGSNET